MTLGYPGSATGGPDASIARLIMSQSNHSFVHQSAIIWPSIYFPSISVLPYTHTYTHASVFVSIQTTHPPIHPSAHSSSIHLLFIHLSIIHSSTHHPSIYPSSILPFIYPSSIHLPVHPLSIHTSIVLLSIHLSILPTCLQLPSSELVSLFQKLRIQDLSWRYCGDAKVLGPSSVISTHPCPWVVPLDFEGAKTRDLLAILV